MIRAVYSIDDDRHLYSFLGTVLAFSDLCGSISSLFSTAVFIAQSQHRKCNLNLTYPWTLVALKRVEKAITEAPGELKATLKACPRWYKGQSHQPRWRGQWFW